MPTFELRFKRSVQKDFKHLGQEAAAMVMKAIRSKLLEEPRAGKQLQGKIDLWSFRVGTYRVLYTFSDQELWILVVSVGHRKEVYKRL
jgi:mRNA interferase RelE/StbE